jgi:hypothetical protein
MVVIVIVVIMIMIMIVVVARGGSQVDCFPGAEVGEPGPGVV